MELAGVMDNAVAWVALSGFVIVLAALLLGKWNGKSLWYHAWCIITDWETYVLGRADEEAAERRRLEKRNRRRPGQMTDFE